MNSAQTPQWHLETLKRHGARIRRDDGTSTELNEEFYQQGSQNLQEDESSVSLLRADPAGHRGRTHDRDPQQRTASTPEERKTSWRS